MAHDNTLKMTALPAAVLLILIHTVLVRGVSANPLNATASHATAANDTQCPVNIPGYTHHGDCNLLCGPASWIDLVKFYVGNYVAHAVTTISSPGQSSAMTILKIFGALFFPGAGVSQGILALSSGAIFAPTDLQMAARAGALCAVVKTPDRPPGPRSFLNSLLGYYLSFSDWGIKLGRQLLSFQKPVRRRKSLSNQEPLDQDRMLRRFEAGPRGAEDIARKNLQVDHDPEMGSSSVEKDVPETYILRPKQGIYNMSFQSASKSSSRFIEGELTVLLEITEPSRFNAIKIHGRCQLPEGYDLVVVPADATFEHDEPEEKPKLPVLRRQWAKLSSPFLPQKRKHITLACSYSSVKILVSIVQLLYAISTLYESRGDQIARYGYAAFGLTVAPYAWMSLVNLVGNLICPQYDAMYIVESSDLDALREEIAAGDMRKGGGRRSKFVVEGTVGRLSLESEKALKDGHRESYVFHALKLVGGVHDSRLAPRRIKPMEDTQKVSSKGSSSSTIKGWLRKAAQNLLDLGNLGTSKSNLSAVVMPQLFTLTSLAPIAIVGALSRFLDGDSSKYQRVWTMVWLSFGSVGGAFFGKFLNLPDDQLMVMSASSSGLTIIAGFASYTVTAIGGYVVVGQMINEYGTCVDIS